MECELLKTCGFFKKYEGSLDSMCKGILSMYCKGEKQDECKRKKYRYEHGTPPEDSMLPNGIIMKEPTEK